MSYTPTPSIETLPDGAIRICIGELCGTVQSGHLIQQKTHQLQAAWLAAHDIAHRPKT